MDIKQIAAKTTIYEEWVASFSEKLEEMTLSNVDARSRYDSEMFAKLYDLDETEKSLIYLQYKAKKISDCLRKLYQCNPGKFHCDVDPDGGVYCTEIRSIRNCIGMLDADVHKMLDEKMEQEEDTEQPVYMFTDMSDKLPGFMFRGNS